MALDPAGDDLDPVDDLARAGGRRGFRGLAEDDDAGGSRVGAARPGGDGQRRRAGRRARRRRPRASGLGRFSAVCTKVSNLQPRCSTGVAAGILPSPPSECTLPAPVARSRPRRLCRVAIRDGGPADQADDFIDGGLASLGIEADEIERAVIGAAHQLFWPGILELLALDLGEIEPERDPDLSQSARGASERSRPAAARAGGGDRLRRGRRRRAARRLRWPGSRSATRRSTPWSRPSRSARARCSRPPPTGPLHGVPVVIKDEWPLPWRAQRFGSRRNADARRRRASPAPTAPCATPAR